MAAKARLASLLIVLSCLVWWQRNGNAQQTNTPAAAPIGETCDAHEGWFAATTEPAHGAIKDNRPDCDFYQAAYSQFLFATQKRVHGPAFLFNPYETVADLFGPAASPLVPQERANILSLTPRTPEQPHTQTDQEPPVLGSGIRQAGGLQGIVVDVNGRPIYYSIHVNNAFARFVRDPAHSLTTPAQLQGASDQLELDPDVVEMKAAWMVVDSKSPPLNFLTTIAVVPHLTKDNDGNISLDSKRTETVTVALIGLHVAFALENHRELVWASFEHVDAAGRPDVAPSAKENPVPGVSPVLEDPIGSFLLFAKGTPLSDANNGRKKIDFNESAQKFAGTTPIYRVFPHSKTGAGSDEEDGEVNKLNENVRRLFENHLPVTDPRYNYRLIGAVWLKHTDTGPPALLFGLDKSFENQPGQSSDDPQAMLSGEIAMSNPAIESYTQQSFENCFGCHNTHAINSDVRPHPQLVGAKLFNVSHVLSKFLAEAPPSR